MRPAKTLLALALCAALLFSFGCAAPQILPAPAGTPVPGPAEPVFAQPLSVPALSPKPLTAPDYDQPQESAPGANAFGFALAQKLYRPGENMVLSPFSVWMTLAALSNAADGSALPALLKALGMEETTPEALNTAASRMLYDLTSNEGKGEGTHNPLAIANAVFVDRDATLKRAFAQSFLDSYRGAAMNVNFRDPAAIAAINAWASGQTKGLITDLVKEIPEDTVAALANAVYFSDRWGVEFDEGKTAAGVFHGAKTDAEAQFMLREGDGLPYYGDAGLQGIDLPFKSGGGMYILLPRDGDAGKLLGSLDAARFSEILSKTGRSTGKLLLPRFSLDSSYNLTDTLKALGVPLFDPDDPKLTGLVEETDAYISAALHQATIRVDEKGTTAAAVTVEMMSGTALPLPTEPFSMVCDHPFVFVLHRWAAGSDQVLFAGVVNQL